MTSLYDCRRLDGDSGGEPIVAETLGYVQHFDAARLQRVAEKHDLQAAVTALPGTYVSPLRPLMKIDREVKQDVSAELAGAFVVGDSRTFDNDPRFGLSVLAEIADRALSSAVNDPGTTIDVLGRLTRLLSNWHPGGTTEPPAYDRVAVPSLVASDLIEDAFRPIARDGAAMIEVVLRLLHTLRVIAELNPFLRPDALQAAEDAIERARKSDCSKCALQTAADSWWHSHKCRLE